MVSNNHLIHLIFFPVFSRTVFWDKLRYVASVQEENKSNKYSLLHWFFSRTTVCHSTPKSVFSMPIYALSLWACLVIRTLAWTWLQSPSPLCSRHLGTVGLHPSPWGHCLVWPGLAWPCYCAQLLAPLLSQSSFTLLPPVMWGFIQPASSQFALAPLC